MEKAEVVIVLIIVIIIVVVVVRSNFFLRGKLPTCRLNGLFSSCHVMSSQDMIFFHNIILFGKNSKASTAYFKGVVRILA